LNLTEGRVTNFRSAEDTGEFDIGQVLCLVGKNEAGKTAVVQAVAGLNPHPATPVTFDVERDYPRRWLTEYSERHAEEKQAVVITTEWSLDDDEKAAIAEVIGPNALQERPVRVLRCYGDTEAQFEAPIDYPAAVEFLINDSRLTASERKQLGSPKNSDDLRKALEAVTERTERQNRLLEKLNGLSGRNVRGAVDAILKKKLPRFMYFSHYDRMVGQIRLDTFAQRKKGQLQPPITLERRLILIFWCACVFWLPSQRPVALSLQSAEP
jgi:predicted ATP-dependent endonuclease of OLD family